MKILTEIPVRQDIVVDVVESHLEVAYANQYDDNTSTIWCHIQNKGVDFNVEDYTATLRVKKSNGKGFSANIGSKDLEGNVQGNVVSFKIPRYLTVSHGKQICNLEFFQKDHVEDGIKYSCTFYLRVNKNALQEEDILDSDYYASVHDEYVKLKTDMTDALTEEQERATQAENTIADNLAAHLDDKENPHDVTKNQLGLGNVEDKSSAAIREEITKANVTDALGYTPYTPNEVDNKLSALETNKVDKIDGKGLSANDFTDDYKETLDNISGGTVTGIKGNAENSYRTGNVNLTKENIGLGNVNNTADSNKDVASAWRVNMPRVAKSASYQPGAGRVVFEEFTAGANYNLPSNAWYHIATGQGADASYNTQFALGMTTDNVAYRRRDGGGWGNWNTVITSKNIGSQSVSSATKASKIIDSYNGNDVTFAYGNSGLNYGDFTWLAAWNGYELRAVNKSLFQSKLGFTPAKSQWTEVSVTGTTALSTSAIFSTAKEIMIQVTAFNGSNYYTYTWYVNPATIGEGNGLHLLDGYYNGNTSIYGICDVRLGRTTAQIVQCRVGTVTYTDTATMVLSYR